MGKENFKSIYKFDDFKAKMIITYLNASAVNMYRTWCIEGKKVQIEEAIQIATNLIKDGLENHLKKS